MKAIRNKPVTHPSIPTYEASSRATAKLQLERLYNDLGLARVRTVDLRLLVPGTSDVRLHDFAPAAGNLSALELLTLCLLVRLKRPRLVLELGTFDGSTALQLAANLDPEAQLVTVDLPSYDFGSKPRFAATEYEPRIRVVHDDGPELDFAAVCAGKRPNFIFMGAEYGEECMREDSRKCLALLAPGGMIAWNDYGPARPRVYEVLNDLAEEIPLVRIAGTSLVVHVASLWRPA
jgi:hypothetical protein